MTKVKLVFLLLFVFLLGCSTTQYENRLESDEKSDEKADIKEWLKDNPNWYL